VAVVRELFAVLGISVDGASFKQADRALANIHGQLVKLNQAGAKGGDAGQSVGDGAAGGAAKAIAAFKSIAVVVAEVAAKVFNAFRDAFTQVASLSSTLGRASRQFGVSAQELQGLGHAVGVAGVSFDSLQGDLSTIQSQMYATTTGSAEAVMAFSRLGISIRKSGGGFKEATKVYDEAIEKLIAIKDPTERAGKALATVGQSGLDVANFWADKGIAAFRDARKEVEEFGALLSDEGRRAFSEFSREQSRLGLVGQSFKNAIGEPLAEILADVSKRFVDWIKLQKGEGPNALRKSVSALGNLKEVFLDLLKWGYRLGTQVLPIIVDILNAVGNVVGTVVVAIRDGLVLALDTLGDVGVAVATGILIAFFPLHALFIGLFLLIEDVIGYTKGYESVTGDAIAAFKKWKEDLFKDEDGNEPLWLFFIKSAVTALTDDLPRAVRALAEVVSGLLTEAFKGLKQTIDGLTKPVSQLVDKIRLAFHQANIATAEVLHRAGAPAAATDFFGGSGFSDVRNKGVDFRTLGVYAKPLDEEAPRVVSVAAPPTAPGGAAGAAGPPISVSVNIDAKGGLNSKEIVEKLRVDLKDFFAEEFVGVLRAAQP
jgi:hypothetical protein